MRMRINRERAVEVFNTLYRHFQEHRFPYNTPEGQPPQVPENFPRAGFASSVDHARFLFTLCLYMRGKIKSHTAVRGLSRIYEEHPEAFDPHIARHMDPQWLQQQLKNAGLGFAKTQNARFWIENIRRLHDSWDGDPRRIFVDANNYDELSRRICNARTSRKRHPKPGYEGFMGFQLKMVSMLIYFLADAKLVCAPTFPLPVDFHVMRIMIAHEAIVVEGGNGNHKLELMQDAIRTFSLWYSEHHQVDALHMSEFVWCFSRSMCDQHPGNISVYEGPRNRRGIIRAKPVTWSKAQQHSYNETCGQCPIESTCKHCIPAAPYYNHGQLIIRGRRDRPPQQRLFPPSQEVLPKKRAWKKKGTGNEAQRHDDKQVKLFKS